MFAKKNVADRCITLCVVLFFVPLWSMKQVSSLVQCGLTPLFVPRDVTGLIQQHLLVNCTLQELGRLRCSSKTTQVYWNFEYTCPYANSQSGICSMAACKRLKECWYNTGTKALGHYDQVQNKAMFRHIWHFDAVTRKHDAIFLLGLNNSDACNLLDEYPKFYGTVEERHKIYCKQLMESLPFGERFFFYSVDTGELVEIDFSRKIKKDLLKKILPGTGFNIYESSYRKKKARTNGFYRMRKILHTISLVRDIDLLFAVLDGYVQPRMFKSMYKHLNFKMLKKLHEMGAMPPHVTDKHEKTADDYYNERVARENSRIAETYEIPNRYRCGGGVRY